MRSKIDELTTFAALTAIRDLQMAEIREAHVDQIPDLKNLCFKVSPALAQRFEDTVKGLGLFKREFLENALLDALATADIVADREGLNAFEAELAEAAAGNSSAHA